MSRPTKAEIDKGMALGGIIGGTAGAVLPWVPPALGLVGGLPNPGLQGLSMLGGAVLGGSVGRHLAKHRKGEKRASYEAMADEFMKIALSKITGQPPIPGAPKIPTAKSGKNFVALERGHRGATFSPMTPSPPEKPKLASRLLG